MIAVISTIISLMIHHSVRTLSDLSVCVSVCVCVCVCLSGLSLSQPRGSVQSSTHVTDNTAGIDPNSAPMCLQKAGVLLPVCVCVTDRQTLSAS